MDSRIRKVSRVAKALSDPTRLELYRRIAGRGEICCRDLTTLLPVSQATVSHHLKVLAEAGLIASRRAGQFSYHRARPGALDEYARALRALGPPARPSRAAG